MLSMSEQPPKRSLAPAAGGHGVVLPETLKQARSLQPRAPTATRTAAATTKRCTATGADRSIARVYSTARKRSALRETLGEEDDRLLRERAHRLVGVVTADRALGGERFRCRRRRARSSASACIDA